MCPDVSLYLFEEYPGQDYYNEIIRTAIVKSQKDPPEFTWPVMEDFAFVKVVALVDVNRPNEEIFVYNHKPSSAGKSPLPRQVYIRLALDDQSTWTKEDHIAHGHLLASKLNEEVAKKKNETVLQWKKDSMKEYYFDDKLSWMTPNELLPLGLYMTSHSLSVRFMPEFLFDPSECGTSWANDYTERINEFFADGKSQAAIDYGVPSNYQYRNDQHRKVTNNESNEQTELRNSTEANAAIVTPVKGKENPSSTDDDGSFDHGVKACLEKASDIKIAMENFPEAYFNKVLEHRYTRSKTV